MKSRKWRCPFCGWYSVFQLSLGTKSLDTYVCGNCSQVVNTDHIHNMPSKLCEALDKIHA